MTKPAWQFEVPIVVKVNAPDAESAARKLNLVKTREGGGYPDGRLIAHGTRTRSVRIFFPGKSVRAEQAVGYEDEWEFEVSILVKVNATDAESAARRLNLVKAKERRRYPEGRQIAHGRGTRSVWISFSEDPVRADHGVEYEGIEAERHRLFGRL